MLPWLARDKFFGGNARLFAEPRAEIRVSEPRQRGDEPRFEQAVHTDFDQPLTRRQMMRRTFRECLDRVRGDRPLAVNRMRIRDQLGTSKSRCGELGSGVERQRENPFSPGRIGLE